jgi:multicomponent Na+:H+ antiporter subunit D
MSAEFALIALLAAPVVQALLALVFARPPGLRDVVFIGFAFAIAGLAVFLVDALGNGASARVVLARPLPNVDLAFSLEPLGVLMAALIAILGAPHAVHAAGIVRATQEKAPARLMAFLALSTASALAVAFSANLFSFFVAYQALILTTFPLVAHRGDDEARGAARIYLATLLAGAIGLLLPALVWTYAIAGALDFQAGGVLAGRVDAFTANALLVLFVFGIGMGAMPPMHRWLPASSQSPNPAFVSIHGGALGIDDSALYQALHRLEGRRLVSADWGVTENKRRARYYTLTKAGRRHLDDESALWQRYAQSVSAILMLSEPT